MKSLIFLILASSAVFSLGATNQIHEHKSKDIGEGTPIPKIEIHVVKDPIDGVNVHVSVQNYTLNAPSSGEVETDDDGILQGHAHVFVNAQKRQSLYGTDIHIPQAWLQDGVNQIAISLNSHNHENWVSEGHNIMSSVFFDLSQTPIVLHDFSSQPLDNTLHAHH